MIIFAARKDLWLKSLGLNPPWIEFALLLKQGILSYKTITAERSN
jgi:hypothetical protein